MKKEIGGYFELEDFGGKEYYPNLYKVIWEEQHFGGFWKAAVIQKYICRYSYASR